MAVLRETRRRAAIGRAGSVLTAVALCWAGAAPAQAVPAAAQAVAVAGASARGMATDPVRQPERLRRLPSNSSWLAAMNHYRAGSGVPAVTANTSWSTGIERHLRYLAKTPARYRQGVYANAHSENPDSPYYTQSGAAAGSSSNLSFGWPTALAAMESWMAAPFHAIGVLRPTLAVSAFAQDKSGDAGLDVIRGATWPDVHDVPVLWPGDGASTQLGSFGGELPNPLETCGWTQAGLPLVAMLPQAPATGTTASLRDETGRAVPVCVVTADTFRSSDPVYGDTARSILTGENAVLVIPRTTLKFTRYTATITQPGQAGLSWSFYRAGYQGQRLPAGSTTPIHVASGPGVTVRGRIRFFGPAGAGTLSVHPCGDPATVGAAVRLSKGRSSSVGAVLAAGAEGDVCLTTTTSLHAAWYPAGGTAGTGTTALFDSRTG